MCHTSPRYACIGFGVWGLGSGVGGLELRCGMGGLPEDSVAAGDPELF